MTQKPRCSEHPDAPHGFNRSASLSEDRYVCDCESWTPDEDFPLPPACPMRDQGDDQCEVCQ